MSIALKHSYEIEYDGSTNCARMDLYADAAADLTGTTTFDGITLLQGSTAIDIETGDEYIMKSDGTWVKQPGAAWVDVYSKSEVDALLAGLNILTRSDLYRGYQIEANTDIDTLTDYGTYYCDSGTTAATLTNCPITGSGFIMINYSNGNRVRIFYAVSANYPRALIQTRTGGIWRTIREFLTKDEADNLYAWIPATLSGTPSITFDSDGTALTAWSISGNMVQTGTPSPDNPVMPTFCGKLVGADWTIPITCAGQTVPVYLGQTQTVRRVKKVVLTGQETWYSAGSATALRFYTRIQDTAPSSPVICTHFTDAEGTTSGTCDINSSRNFVCNNSGLASTVDEWKIYASQQYAAGTPITVWYVLETPETAIVNEPLAKIGDYADELSSEDASVTIPTIKGQNTLTVETVLQPSAVSITGGIR